MICTFSKRNPDFNLCSAHKDKQTGDIQSKGEIKMFQAKTGSSVLSLAYEAGKEAASKAKDGLSDVKSAFVYASCAYDLGAMIKGIKEQMPGVPFIGNTSFTGVMTPEGYISGPDGFIGMMALADSDLTVGIGYALNEGSAVKAGHKAAEEALKSSGTKDAPDYFYMTAPPGEEEYFLKGISEVIGRVPFFGGSAADNSISGEWKLFTDKGVFDNGVAVEFFYTDKKITNYFTGAYNETKDVGVITKINGNRTLVEIDNIPALDKYAAWRKMDKNALLGGNLLVEAIVSPLGVKDPIGDLVAIRHPMNGNTDGSMNIGNNLAVGTAVIRMEATVDEPIDSTGDTVIRLKERAGADLGAMLLVHCGGRRAGIADRIEEVSESIMKAAGDVPYLVEFTFGEYGYESDGRNTCGGLMLSFTGFFK